jgi:hypothetical protein
VTIDAPQKSPLSPARAWAVAAVVYAGLAAWAGAGLRGSGERILGIFASHDLVGTVWTWWWTAEALLGAQSPASCDRTFFPDGLWPVSQFNLVDAVMAAPFMAALGPAAGASATVLAMVFTNGLAGRWLALRAGLSSAAATAAGALIAHAPHALVEASEGRPTQAWLAPLLLALGAWLGVARSGGWAMAALAGAASALTFLHYWYYGAFLAAAAAVVALTHAGALRTADGRRRLVHAAAGVGLALALIAPFVGALLGPDATLPGIGRQTPAEDFGPLGRGEVGLNFAIGSSRWPLWFVYGDPVPVRGTAIPVSALLLAFVPLVAWRRGRATWLALGLLGWVLSLGPYLQAAGGGIVSEVPLPFLWLYDGLPLFDRLWWPYRWAVLVAIAVPMLVARTVDDIAAEVRVPRAALALAAASVVLVEGWLREPHLPLAADEVRRPGAVYSDVEGAFVAVPLVGPSDTSRLHLWYQTFHGKPMLYGLGAHLDGHRPAATDARMAGNALLRALRAAEVGLPVEEVVTEADVAALRVMGFTDVVVERAAWPEEGWDGVIDDAVVPLLEEALGPADAVDGTAMRWRL